MKFIIATGINNLANAIRNIKGVEVVKVVDNTADLNALFQTTQAPCEVLLVTEKLNISGSLVNLLTEIKSDYPQVRIIYLATGTLDNAFTVNQLNMLARNGIYDLYYNGKVRVENIVDLIKNPKTIVDCQPIFDKFAENEANNAAAAQNIVIQKADERKSMFTQDTVKSNVVTVTSVKPGTGKSFISSNLAVTIAKYGKDNPRVLLLEGDLQTLSVSTLFGIRNDEYNIKKCLTKISQFFEKNDYNDWFRGAGDVKNFIDKSCIPTGIANLYVLEGHEFSLEDVSDTENASFYYLVDYLASKFDVVVCDGNSSLQHPTTDPLFQLSNRLYFVYTTEFNNLKLNIRYKEEFKKLGVENKVRYVLNKALHGDQKMEFLQQFQYDDKDILSGSGMNIDFEVPLLDTAVTFNATYNKTPIANDGKYFTLPIRIKFLRLANDVYPIGNIDSILGEVEALKKRTKGKKKKKQ